MQSAEQRLRLVTARRIVGRKKVGDRVYTYEYYTLPLNIYLPRSFVERWGTEFVVLRDDEKGIVVVMPRKVAEEQGIKIK